MNPACFEFGFDDAGALQRYARAFADVVAQKNSRERRLDRQLNDFLSHLGWQRRVARALCQSGHCRPQKVANLDKMNAKLGLRKELRNLLAVLINNDRIGEVREVVQAYRAEMQERQGIRRVEIVTARELGEKERKGLVAGVGKLAGARDPGQFQAGQIHPRRNGGAHRLHGLRRLASADGWSG